MGTAAIDNEGQDEGQDKFRFTGKGKNREGWGDTPLAGQHIVIDRSETVEGAIEAGHFESEASLLDAAYGQRRIRLGAVLRDAYDAGTVALDALAAVANGFTFGLRKSTEERGAQARERAEAARTLTAARAAAQTNPEMAEMLRKLGML